MRYSVSHLTTLKYAAPVQLAQFNIRLRPAAWPGQVVSDYRLTVDPQPAQVVDGEGGYYINEARFALRKPIAQLRIESRFIVEREPLPFFVTGSSGPGLADLRERAMKKPDLSARGPRPTSSPRRSPRRSVTSRYGPAAFSTMRCRSWKPARR